jgi:predicted short-subunit dehydrogenase-like oxidoreductase (DUF2520 family)
MTSVMSEIEVNARAMSEGPAEPTPVVFIMGAGVVGTALAARLVRAGVPVAGLHGRQVDLSDAASAVSGVLASTGDIPAIFSESEVIIISVRDERIPEVAERLVREKKLRPDQVVLHTSGANASAQILAAARPHVRAVGTLHPLVSFADAHVAVEQIRHIAFGIEGDAPAKAVAKRLVRALGAQAVELDAASLPLYHAGAVLAANYVVALADLAQGLLVKAGVPQDQALPALIPLLSSVVQNLATLGLPGALTGPVERGDVSSVEQHLRILESRAPEMLELYRLMGRDVLRLARMKSKLDPAAIGRLEGLFAGGETNGKAALDRNGDKSGKKKR